MMIFVIINYIYPNWYSGHEYTINRNVLIFIIVWLPILLGIVILALFSLVLHNNKYKKVWKYIYFKTIFVIIALLGIFFIKQMFEHLSLSIINILYITLFVVCEILEYRIGCLLKNLEFSLKYEWNIAREIEKNLKTEFKSINKKFTMLEVVFLLLGMLHLKATGFYICAVILIGISYYIFGGYIKQLCSFGINKRILVWSCYGNYICSILLTVILYDKLETVSIFLCLFSGLLAKYYWNCRLARILHEQ